MSSALSAIVRLPRISLLRPGRRLPPLDSIHRLYIFAGVLVLWTAAIGIRLVGLQIFEYGALTQRAQRQQLRTIEVAPRRGVIYDRNGNELAMTVAVSSVFAVPSEIPDHATTAALLARILAADKHEILARMKSSQAFAWVARKVDADTADRIRKLNLRGIYLQKESKRFYPKRELAAQVLGYVGLDDEGLGGIERAFDEHLRGRPGAMLITLDARRKWFGRVERKPDPGQSLVLTIDEKIQYIAERELEAAMQQTRARTGTVMVQNPRTGEVLALASRPTFNPNMFNKVPAAALKNRAVSDVYEPGSTFKIVTVAAALEEKLTRPEEMIDCQMGAIVIGGMRIRDHAKFGIINVAGIIAHSSDVGAIKLGLRLGSERFDQYIRSFGFGSQSGIELPGESRGLAKPVGRWSKVSIGAISMGQEIGITAVQLAGLLSTVANDGVWTQPRIIAHEPSGLGNASAPLQPPVTRRVVSPLTAVEMKRMLHQVVVAGTGRKAQLNGYTAAGKTGTAQKTDPVTGAYSHTDYVASFAGFAPVNNPAVTVVVILDSAVGLHQGGQIAAPVFQRVTQQVLSYLNVPHDGELKPQRALQMAKLKDAELSEASPDRLGSAMDAYQPGIAPAAPVPTPTAQPAAAPAGTVVVDVEGGVVVPSMLGKPVRAALDIAQDAGIEIDVIGNGVAREQSPPPGTRISQGARVEVRFAR